MQPQRQQQVRQQQWDGGGSGSQLVDVDYLNDVERQLIISVLDRDAAIRQKEQARINQIKREMRELRLRGVIRGGNHDDVSRKCARCRKKFVWLINSARVCSRCNHRVCDACCQRLPHKRSMCNLCLKQLELEAMTGQWFYVISANNNRDRKSNEVACGSDIIRESIRTARRPNLAPTANGTSVGSTFDDVRRALVRSLDASTSLDGGPQRQSVVSSDVDVLAGTTTVAFPGDEDRQLLHDLQDRRKSVDDRRRSFAGSPTDASVTQDHRSHYQQQQQYPTPQRVEVRRIGRQASETSPVTSPDSTDAVGDVPVELERLSALEQFRRNEAKRASVISHTSSLVSSDGTINVVTDSEDEEEQTTTTTPTKSTQLMPSSPGSRQLVSSPTDNGVPLTKTERPHPRAARAAAHQSSMSPQRGVSASGDTSQPNGGVGAVDDVTDSAAVSPVNHHLQRQQQVKEEDDHGSTSVRNKPVVDEEEVEDIGEMFAAYSGKSGSIRATSRSNLNRMSPFSSSKESLTSMYTNAGDSNTSKFTVSGDIEFGLAYNYKQSMLEVHVKRCRGIAAVDTKRNSSDPYVKMYLLPDKTKNGKRKSRVKKHTLHPIFDEVLKYSVTKSELESRTLCVMVWNSDKLGRNDFLGEVNVTFDHHSFDDPTPKFYKLQDRNVKSPLSMLTYKGDVNVCLKYVTSEQLISRRDTAPSDRSSSSLSTSDIKGGELLVLVKQARNLTAVRSNGFSDPFCKCCLLPDRSRSASQKSPVIRRNCNPAWNHTFVFESVRWLELKDRCLELTIWDFDRLVSNDFLGGVRLNLGTGKSWSESVDWMDSKGDEISLWQAMLDRPNCWIEGTLLLRPHMADRH